MVHLSPSDDDEGNRNNNQRNEIDDERAWAGPPSAKNMINEGSMTPSTRVKPGNGIEFQLLQVVVEAALTVVAQLGLQRHVTSVKMGETGRRERMRVRRRR